MKKLLAVILSLLIPISSFATTYYASTGGSGSFCSIGLPCTIGTGISKLSSGDTLMLNDGTYDAVISNTVPSGSMGTPTTIKAVNNQLAIIKPTSVPGGGLGLIWLFSKSYITFDGIVQDGATGAATNDGFRLDQSDHIIIQNAEIRNNNIIDNSNCSSTSNGVEVTSTGTHGSTFDQFLNNYVHDNGGFCAGTDNNYEGLGYYIQESDDIIDGNTFVNNAEADVQFRNGSGDPAAGLNNILRNSSLNGSPRTGVFIANYSDNTLVYNNTIYGVTGGYGITFYQNPDNSGIYNNTIYNNSSGCIHLDNSGGSAATNTTIKNNICRSNGGVAITNTGTATTCSNNLNVTSCGSTEGSTDPLFVSPGSGNFHIQSGSPAIGIGANLCSTFCADTDGNPRPSMGAWDAGAFIGPMSPLATTRGFFAF